MIVVAVVVLVGHRRLVVVRDLVELYQLVAQDVPRLVHDLLGVFNLALSLFDVLDNSVQGRQVDPLTAREGVADLVQFVPSGRTMG